MGSESTTTTMCESVAKEEGFGLGGQLLLLLPWPLSFACAAAAAAAAATSSPRALILFFKLGAKFTPRSEP